MKQADDLLRQACAEIAREEADSFEQSLTRSANREAEELSRHHRLKALRVIQRHTKKPGQIRSLLLPLAAALIAVLGGALLSLRSSPPDALQQSQPPTEIMVQPYYTPETTGAFSSTAAPTPTVLPTEEAVIFPTVSPIIDNNPIAATTEPSNPTNTPTLSPTFTPLPIASPTPVPTAEPAPAPTPLPVSTPEPESTSLVPAGWQGEHFPTLLPPGFELASVTREDDCCTAAYTRYGQTLIFTEYNHARLIEAPKDADYEYIQVNGIVVLQARTDSGVTLTWEMDDHTLSLFTPQGDGIDIAESVEKISKP